MFSIGDIATQSAPDQAIYASSALLIKQISLGIFQLVWNVLRIFPMVQLLCEFPRSHGSCATQD